MSIITEQRVVSHTCFEPLTKSVKFEPAARTSAYTSPVKSKVKSGFKASCTVTSSFADEPLDLVDVLVVTSTSSSESMVLM